MVTLTEVSSMGSLVMAVAAFLSFLALWKTYRENNITTVKYLGLFFAHFGMFQLLLGLPYLIGGLGDVQLRAFAIFSHIFLYLGLAYFSRITVYIFKQEWEYYVFAINLLVGAIAMFVMLSSWSRSPALIAIPTLFNLVLLGTVPFIYMGVKQDGIDRLKMVGMSIGFLMVAIAGPLHNVASTPAMMAGAEAVTVLGTLVILGGVYVKRLAQPGE